MYENMSDPKYERALVEKKKIHFHNVETGVYILCKYKLTDE